MCPQRSPPIQNFCHLYVFRLNGLGDCITGYGLRPYIFGYKCLHYAAASAASAPRSVAEIPKAVSTSAFASGVAAAATMVDNGVM